MAEFTELPIAAGPLVPRSIFNELTNAINSRLVVVQYVSLADLASAFTIYNNSGDADDATVEIDRGADEIYLIVIGGANASNTTLDLTHADYNTMRELVAAINALAKGWVAVNKGAGNTNSTTLYNSNVAGPAHVLGAAQILWLTNYSVAPNVEGIGLMSGSLIRKIAMHRAYIEVAAPYFYRQDTIGVEGITATTAAADDSLTDAGNFTGLDLVGATCTIEHSTGGATGDFVISANTDDKLLFTTDPGNGTDVYYFIIPLAYTADTLQDEALGSTAWTPLTARRVPLKSYWNEMKSCLDLLKWVKVDNQAGGWWSGKQWAGNDDDPVWNTARATAFGNLAPGAAGVETVGRMMSGFWSIFFSRYYCNPGADDANPAQTGFMFSQTVSKDGFTTGDISGISPLSIVDGYLHVYLQENDWQPAPYHDQDFQLDLKVEGTLVNSVSIDVEPDVTRWQFVHMDNIADPDLWYEEYVEGIAATTAAVDDSLSDAGAFTGLDLTDRVCTIWKSTGGGTGNFTITGNNNDKLSFTADPGNGTAVHYYIQAGNDEMELEYVGVMTDDPGVGAWPAPPVDETVERFREGTRPSSWVVYCKFDFD